MGARLRDEANTLRGPLGDRGFWARPGLCAREGRESEVIEMELAAQSEARIVEDGNVLLLLSESDTIEGFFGRVLAAADLSESVPSFAGKSVYLCGDLSTLSQRSALSEALKGASRVLVVADRSRGYDESSTRWQIIDTGRVPIGVHGVGVLYRRFFDIGAGYFQRISAEHEFQLLTESTKPGLAHRTGIYLTPVERSGEELRFRLLRCSTNLSGPTEGFRATDTHIVEALNQESARVFIGAAPLNHVLAQIYHNTPASEEQKQTKAKIKAHSDKTKDMPKSGIMAFCTFYDGLERLSPLPTDPFDYGHNKASGLTRLVFRLKPRVAERPGCELPRQLEVTLYPGSVFFMPLSTNRLYTHEIRPSALDAARLPTRLGYVVRCSSTEAVHKDGQTFLSSRGALTRLLPPTPEGMDELRGLYAEENRTDEPIDYAGRFLFSMNEGDYIAPRYDSADEFRRYLIPARGPLFEELSAGVSFEEVTRGRLGAVIVLPDDARGVPIVRTTTSYALPARRFTAAHERLARQIQSAASLPYALDNALVERYSDAYASMGAHSDQAQDLREGSHIALFSCYLRPDEAPTRTLVVESKEPGGGTFAIPLLHNSAVVFSLEANRRFRHKIVLEGAGRAPGNDWLGLTFRASATFVRYGGGQAVLEGGAPLQLAGEEQRRELYALRRRENQELRFVYPELPYTVSPSDLAPPGQ